MQQRYEEVVKTYRSHLLAAVQVRHYVYVVTVMMMTPTVAVAAMAMTTLTIHVVCFATNFVSGVRSVDTSVHLHRH